MRIANYQFSGANNSAWTSDSWLSRKLIDLRNNQSHDLVSGGWVFLRNIFSNMI